MFKLQNQFKIISIFLFILLGILFINNNKKLYAFPAIDLDARKIQLEEEINSLIIQFNQAFNNTNLEPQERFNRMVGISNRLDTTIHQLLMINQQIIERNQNNLQRQNNQNKPNK